MSTPQSKYSPHLKTLTEYTTLNQQIEKKMMGTNHLDIDKMFGISLEGDPRFEYLRQIGCFT